VSPTKLAEGAPTIAELRAAGVTSFTGIADGYGIDWLQNGRPGFNQDHRQMIQDAFDEFPDLKNPPSASDIVAELKFAFWVGILAPQYDGTLWRKALFRAFLGKNGQKRSIVHGRVNALRRFRNRVMHHEPIFHRPLQQTHDEIIEAIEWMCPETSAWTAHHSRFDDVISTLDDR
jgi:hypothetical protein